MFSRVVNNLARITNATANFVCFVKDTIPYQLQCNNSGDGNDLQGYLFKLLNTSCEIIQTNISDCLEYRNDYQYFGSSAYGKPLCELGYPRFAQPDSCVITNLKNFTPIQTAVPKDDPVTIAVGTAGALLTFGLFSFGAIKLSKYLSAKNNIESDEETTLLTTQGAQYKSTGT